MDVVAQVERRGRVGLGAPDERAERGSAAASAGSRRPRSRRSSRAGARRRRPRRRARSASSKRSVNSSAVAAVMNMWPPARDVGRELGARDRAPGELRRRSRPGRRRSRVSNALRHQVQAVERVRGVVGRLDRGDLRASAAAGGERDVGGGDQLDLELLGERGVVAVEVGERRRRTSIATGESPRNFRQRASPSAIRPRSCGSAASRIASRKCSTARRARRTAPRRGRARRDGRARPAGGSASARSRCAAAATGSPSESARARGGAQRLDHPGVAARRGQREVRGDLLRRGAARVQEPGGAAVARRCGARTGRSL